jgi:glycerophosphoryl diester phosphodiesterase
MPALIAHRGASADAPENTLAAFELAWRQGADGIEGDFRLTRDGEIVCMHDASAERTAARAVNVAEATLAELRQLDSGAWMADQWRGLRIPTLGEVLATVPAGRQAFIELKCGPEIVPALEAVLAAFALPAARIALLCFDTRVVAEAKRRLPGFRALWLTGFTTSPTTGVRPSAAEILETLEAAGADGVGCSSHAAVDQALVETLHAAQKEVHVWTVDDVPTAERYLKLGIDSITSNRAGWLKQQLGIESATTMSPCP